MMINDGVSLNDYLNQVICCDWKCAFLYVIYNKIVEIFSFIRKCINITSSINGEN